MSEQPMERLAWENRFVQNLVQTVEGADCFAPFVSLHETQNLIALQLTAQEIKELLSSILTGADICYPEKSHQIYVNFLKGIHCPPIMQDQECFEYPSYASFLNYAPMNPYVEPDVIPDGYEIQPFLVNGENGNDIPGYEHFDVIVPSAAITFDVDWFTTIAGQLPTVTAVVDGAGKAFLKLLTIPQGGLVVVTLDTPPNLIDILAGIVTGAENIIDLNQDLVSLPPETAKEIIFEVDIVGTGLHTIYMVFLPILDDSLIPIRFGGGFRGVQLCNFVEVPEVGITALRFQDCNLEAQVNGEWSIVDGWEDWLDCIPSGGGGGGLAAIAAITNNQTLPANQTFTNTTYNNLSVGSFQYVRSKANAIVQVSAHASNNVAQTTHIRPAILSGGSTIINGENLTEAMTSGTTARTLICTDIFLDITDANPVLVIDKKVGGGTGSILAAQSVEWVVIEFDDISELFVEDIRIVGRELQKKIGGAWITVTDSLATILNQIEAIANNALATAQGAVTVNTNQQSQINSIISVNNSQQTQINNHETRIDSLEEQVTEIITLDIPQINSTLANHEARLDALEAAMGVSDVWAHVFDFKNVGSSNWLIGANTTFAAGIGFYSPVEINLHYTPKAWGDQRFSHIGLTLRWQNAPHDDVVLVQIPDTGNYYEIHLDSAITQQTRYSRIDTGVSGQQIHLRISQLPDDLVLESIRLMGRGTNPFTDPTYP